VGHPGTALTPLLARFWAKCPNLVRKQLKYKELFFELKNFGQNAQNHPSSTVAGGQGVRLISSRQRRVAPRGGKEAPQKEAAGAGPRPAYQALI
jgi:hypothetical protein